MDFVEKLQNDLPLFADIMRTRLDEMMAALAMGDIEGVHAFIEDMNIRINAVHVILDLPVFDEYFNKGLDSPDDV